MDRLLSPTEAGDLVGFSAYTIRDAIKSGELRGRKMRGRWKIEPADLEAWKDRCVVETQPAAVVRDLPRPIHRMTIPEGGFRQLAREQNRRERDAA